jgi:Na+/H+ antiporter NhaA
MALFIAGLALKDAELTAAKVGVLTASVVSAAVGLSLLMTDRSTAPEPRRLP